jgi:hypothetical protein
MLISNFFSDVDKLLTTSLKLKYPLPSLLTPSLYPFSSTDASASPGIRLRPCSTRRQRLVGRRPRGRICAASAAGPTHLRRRPNDAGPEVRAPAPPPFRGFRLARSLL